MKHLILALAVASSALAVAPLASAQTARIESRDQNQMRRIEDARARGTLTQMEYRQLLQGQRQIDWLQRRAERDGFVSPRERNSIVQAQNREAARITRFENNRRGGGPRMWHR